jgi:coupling of ubiquitin conjugation to ER degradation protein 1
MPYVFLICSTLHPPLLSVFAASILTPPPIKPPPAYYALFPRETNPIPAPAPARPAATATKPTPKESLISRYHLEERVTTEKPVPDEMVGGKAVWEDSPEKREASLRERKAMMILAARQ